MCDGTILNIKKRTSYRFVCDQEAARRAHITTAPGDAAADVDARTKDVAAAKKAVGAANDDKLALVDARLIRDGVRELRGHVLFLKDEILFPTAQALPGV